MSPFVSPDVIEVRIWGRRVGAVARDDQARAYAFEFADTWKRTRIELAPLRMPLAEASRPFVFPELSEETFRGLPGMLSDSLPDQFGNALVDAWMVQRGVARDAITSLDRLAYMGRRGLGALEFRPIRGPTHEAASALELKKLVEEARRAVEGDFTDDRHAQAALANIIRVGTSAGGARAKAVVAWNPKTHEIRSGQFDVAPGFEHWLVKFDGVKGTEFGESKNYGRIEYAYYLMARDAGIVMTECRLLHENERAHFMTKRFDRDGNRKHHVLTLCGMDHLDFNQRATHGYEQFFDTLARLNVGDGAMEQGFRRMTFNVLAQNCDDHPKNFSFLLAQDGVWVLAPAYDITHAHNPRGQWTSQHLMSVNGKFTEILDDDLLTVAERFRIPRARAIINEIRSVVLAWDTYARKAEVPQADQVRIRTDISSLVEALA